MSVAAYRDPNLNRLARQIAEEDYGELNDLFALNKGSEPRIVWNPSPTALSADILANLLRHWHAMRLGRELPAPADVDPIQIRFALGHVMLLDIVDGGRDLRYRLFGTTIVDHMGDDLTGRLVSESYQNHVGSFYLAVYRAAIARRQPVFTHHSPPAYMPVTEWNRLLLPLADADGTIVRFMAGAIPGPRRTDRLRSVDSRLARRGPTAVYP